MSFSSVDPVYILWRTKLSKGGYKDHRFVYCVHSLFPIECRRRFVLLLSNLLVLAVQEAVHVRP